MLRKGRIISIPSPYASPVVLCRKNKGLPADNPEAYRFVVDYRKLNAITRYPRFPLPLIEDLITNIPHTTLMSSLDQRSGYFQLVANSSDVVKKTFVTKNFAYAFKRMPFRPLESCPEFSESNRYNTQSGIRELTNCKNLSSRMIRWTLKLAEFNVEWEHRLGAQNVVADVLSRNPVESIDPELGYIYGYLENPDDSSVNVLVCGNWSHDFKLVDSLLFYANLELFFMNSVASTLNRVTGMEFNNQISVLTPNNWNTWKHDMQVLLMHYGCWQFIIQTKPEQTDEEATYKEKLDLQLRFQLIRWLPREFQSTVQQIYRWKEEDFRVVKIEAELILEANRLQLMKQDLEKAENAYLSSFTSKKSKTLPGATAAAHGDPNGKNDYQKKSVSKTSTETPSTSEKPDVSSDNHSLIPCTEVKWIRNIGRKVTGSNVYYSIEGEATRLKSFNEIERYCKRHNIEYDPSLFNIRKDNTESQGFSDLSEQQEALMVEVTILTVTNRR
ncbi:retrovirus-related Pol polyprotein from transposon TNT 1-94 [Trichonephila clavipes]|nr:retrovirus-related Pol polyprotein from transposon TNT 1-94 [Trichonephila clavipes]